MAIVLLASVSLFALVVSGRPILPDADLSDFAPTSSTPQTAVQAAFRIPGQDDLKLDAARFQAQKPKQQIEYLAKLDVEGIGSFEVSPVRPSFEAPVDQNAAVQDAFDVNSELNDAAGHIADEPIAVGTMVDDSQEAPTDGIHRAPLVVLAFSCVAAFLALLSVALTLYIVKSLRSQALAPKTAWELLPHFWSRPTSPTPKDATVKKHILGGGRLPLQPGVGQRRLLHAEEGSTERHDLQTEDKPPFVDAASDMESEWDDVDEKYQDALDMTPLPLIHDLPLEEHESHPSHFGNPPLLEAYPPGLPTGDRSPLMMCELSSSWPAWSVRAIDSPALGLPSREIGGVDFIPQPLVHPRRCAYRSAVAEFDMALAMQLRPGLGIGADSAWMVRFLMAIFGWFAVALTGNTR